MLILLIIINILLLLPILSIQTPRKYFNYLFNNTIYFCKSALGYLISLIGKIRMGKTTLMSGLSHVFQIIIMGKNNENMVNIRSLFYFIDFNEFETFIIMDIENGITDLEEITEHLLQIYQLDKNHLIYNYLNFETVGDLIYTYVESFYVLAIRNQYVYSKTYFYSHLTNKSNLNYNIEWTKINEAYQNKNYAIYNNFVELIDEATDEIGSSKRYEDLKDESGAKEYRRKYGHLHKETNYMITTKQDSSDEVARFRRLTQSNIVLDERVKVIGSFRFTIKLLNMIKNIPLKFNRFKFNIIAIFKGMLYQEEREQYIDMKLKGKVIGRKLNFKINFVEKFLFSLSYCKFKTRIYFDETDVGKENLNGRKYYEEFNFVIPLRYCFGCFNTHEFSYIQDELIKNSEISFEELEQGLMFMDINKKYFA